ncbi:MAG: hypothetical protein ABJQ70_00105 [Roseobacter sp.]
MQLHQGALIAIDPGDIAFLQFPEFHKLGASAPQTEREFTPGDWDHVQDRVCYWGARYEGGRRQPVGMVPLENYRFLTALQDHFHKGTLWEETDWYNWMHQNGPSRYNTSAKIKLRLRFLEDLYASCRAGTYDMHNSDPPLINIGRAGRIAIEDGRHRICVAKAAGLRRIMVRINAVHPDHQNLGA